MFKVSLSPSKHDKDSTSDRRVGFGERKVAPRLESAFVFPAARYIGLELHRGEKGEKPVPKKS